MAIDALTFPSRLLGIISNFPSVFFQDETHTCNHVPGCFIFNFRLRWAFVIKLKLSWSFGDLLSMLWIITFLKIMPRWCHVKRSVIVLLFDLVLVTGMTLTSRVPWLVAQQTVKKTITTRNYPDVEFRTSKTHLQTRSPTTLSKLKTFISIRDIAWLPFS